MLGPVASQTRQYLRLELWSDVDWLEYYGRLTENQPTPVRERCSFWSRVALYLSQSLPSACVLEGVSTEEQESRMGRRRTVKDCPSRV